MASSPYGKAIANGVILYFSATSLSTGDPNEDGGCPRKYAFKYGLRYPMPEQDFQRTGIDLHNEVEHFLKTGERTLGPLAMAIAPWIPAPGPDLEIEREIWLPSSGTPPPVTAAGVGVVGKQDLRHARGVYIDSRGELVAEVERNVVEVQDWKTTSDIAKWSKPGDRLLQTVQMATYGKHECNRDPDVGYVRLSHVYSQTKGARLGKKTTMLAPRDAIERRWESVEGVARSLVDVVKLAVDKDAANRVDANTRACGAYRGCPYRADVGGPCTAGNSLATLFGPSNEGGSAAMSLLNVLKVPAATSAPTPPAAAVNPLAAARAELARLEAEAKVNAALEAVPGFAEAVATIDKAGRGWPQVAGEAARLKAYAKGIADQYKAGAAYGGSGELAALPTISDPAIIVQLAAELVATAEGRKGGETAPPPPPDTVAADAEASRIANEAAKAATVTDAPASSAPPELLPPGAPTSTPENASAGPKVEATPEAPKTKGKGGRKTKTASATEVITYDPADVKTEAADVLEVYVDCIPSKPYESLHPMIDQINKTMCETVGKDAEGNAAVDIRCAGKNTALAFGQWKGVLHGYVLKLAKEGGLPRGVYVLDTRGSELAEVVADALRNACDLYVRGVR
jgi:hypothetical protein